MKNLRLLVFPLAWMISLFPSAVWAQRQTPSISLSSLEINVQVRNPDGTPAPQGIHVTLELAEGGPAGDCMTVNGGRCHFIPQSTGAYVVRIKQSGYKETSARVEIISTPKGYATLDLKPIPVAGEPAPPKSAEGNKVSITDLGVPDNARDEFEKGQKSLSDNNVDESISHFKKAIKLHESFPQAYTMLGTAYLQQNDLKDAQPAFEKAVQLDPKSAEAYIKLGATFNQLKNYPEAEKALNHGLELNPEATAGHYELAKTYWAMGRWQEAEPHAVKALAALPDVPLVHVLMGNILLKKKDAQGALHEFQEYLRLDPNGSMAPAVHDIVAKIQKALATQ